MCDGTATARTPAGTSVVPACQQRLSREALRARRTPPLRVRLPHGDALENECAVMQRDARQRARRAMGEERRRLTGQFYGVVMVYIIVMGRYEGRLIRVDRESIR